MNLFLLRHGLAVERTVPGFKLDSDRPLTPEGRKKIGRLAAVLGQLHLSFDLILTSPFVRTKQTAGIIAETLDSSKVLKASENLAPGDTFEKLVDELSHRHGILKEVLLVGHEPGLSRFISILVTGKRGLALDLKKGGLCKLEVETLRLGRCATLQWLLTPKLYSPFA